MFPPVNPVCFLRQLCVLPKSSTTNTIQTWEKGSTLKHCNSISRIICISWAVLEHHCEFKWTCSGSELSDTVNRWKQTQRFVVCQCNFSHHCRKVSTAKFMSQKRSFISPQHISNSSLNFWLILFTVCSKLRWSDGWSSVLFCSGLWGFAGSVSRQFSENFPKLPSASNNWLFDRSQLIIWSCWGFGTRFAAKEVAYLG